MAKRPPLGVMPRYIWEERRLEELRDAIYRYISDVIHVPPAWIEEYNELIEKRKQR